MLIYLVYYGEENGDRGDCSIFYTPCESFLSLDKAEARVKELESDAVTDEDIDDDLFYTELRTETVEDA